MRRTVKEVSQYLGMSIGWVQQHKFSEALPRFTPPILMHVAGKAGLRLDEVVGMTGEKFFNLVTLRMDEIRALMTPEEKALEDLEDEYLKKYQALRFIDQRGNPLFVAEVDKLKERIDELKLQLEMAA